MTRRVLTLVGLAVLAFFVALVPGGVWSLLLALNLRVSPAFPWAALTTGVLLWFLWSYLRGDGPPASTSAARRRMLRAERLPSRVFAWAVAAGLLGIVALSGLWIVLMRLVKSHGNVLPDFSRYPLWTVAASLVMASILGGVTEEAGFRGYLQGALEGQVGGALAVVITAVLMSPAHALTQGFVWTTLLFYLLVDIMLGVSALLTRSIVPGLIVHSAGLLTFFAVVWPHDAARLPITVARPDTWFWVHVAQAVVCSALSILAFMHVAQIVAARRARAQEAARRVDLR